MSSLMNSELFNIHDSSNTSYSFEDALYLVQEYMANQFSSLLHEEHESSNSQKNGNSQKESQIKSYIQKYVHDNKICVKGLNQGELIDKLYRDMALFGFLTDYLNRSDVEEININAWDDTKVTYTNGAILPSEESFLSPKHAEDTIKKLLRQSNMILDSSQPIVRGHLSKNIRITVLGRGVIDDDIGVVASIRIVNPQNLNKKDFVKKDTFSDEMIDTIEVLFRYGISMCITGATSSGKTTFMSWLLGTIPDDKRIFTIENNTREFDLVKKDENGKVINNVVHTVTRYSEDESKSIDQEKLLETSLTSNPDFICVGEMKGSESFSAQEAARTGHTVITTTHANSCEATYSRMVTLCKTKYDMNDRTLYDLVTEAFPIVVFLKKLEDNTRKAMEITECVISENGERKLRTLFRYNIKSTSVENGKTKIVGGFEKVNNISEKTQKRLLENGMPRQELDKLLVGGGY